MWAFLSRRFRQWALFALAVPVAGWLVERLRVRAAAARGESSKITRALHQAGRALDTVDRRGRRRRR